MISLHRTAARTSSDTNLSRRVFSLPQETRRTFRREIPLGLAAPDHTVPYGTVLSRDDRGRDKGRLCPSLRTGLPNFLDPALQLVVTFKKIGMPQCVPVLRRTSPPRRSRYLAIGSDLFLWPGLSVSSGA